MAPNFLVILIDYDPDLFDLTPAIKEAMEFALAQIGAELQVGQHRSEEAVLSYAAQADLVMVQSVRALLTGAVIRKLTHCRGIIRMGLGYDSIDLAAATEMGIPVSNVVDWCTDEVAEHAIALLLSGARHIPALNSSLKSGSWKRTLALPTYRLRGKCVGIIGFGRIGQAVALRLSGFGMTLLAYDPYIDADTIAQFHAQKVRLEELLAGSDFISVHARLSAETWHLIGAAELGQMKPGAFLVNTSRGAIIDEIALIETLRSGRLSGAALDVMEIEPLPDDSPLRRMEQVTLTPHLSSYSEEAVAELYQKSTEIAVNLLTGRQVGTIVNPEFRRQDRQASNQQF